MCMLHSIKSFMHQTCKQFYDTVAQTRGSPVLEPLTTQGAATTTTMMLSGPIQSTSTAIPAAKVTLKPSKLDPHRRGSDSQNLQIKFKSYLTGKKH